MGERQGLGPYDGGAVGAVCLEPGDKAALFPVGPGVGAVQAAEAVCRGERRRGVLARGPYGETWRDWWVGQERRWYRAGWPWYRRLWLVLAAGPVAFAAGAHVSGWPWVTAGMLAGVGLAGLFFLCLALNNPRWHRLRGDTVLAVLVAGSCLLDLDGVLMYLAGRNAFAWPTVLVEAHRFELAWVFFTMAVLGVLVLKSVGSLMMRRLAEGLPRVAMAVALLAAYVYGPIIAGRDDDDFLRGLERAVAERGIEVEAIKQWLGGEAVRLIEEDRLVQVEPREGPLGWLIPEEHWAYVVQEEHLQPALRALEKQGEVALGYDPVSKRVYAGLTHGTNMVRWGLVITVEAGKPKGLERYGVDAAGLDSGMYVWRLPSRTWRAVQMPRRASRCKRREGEMEV